MTPRKRSFFERLTGVVRFDDEDLREPELPNDDEPANERGAFPDTGHNENDAYWTEASRDPVEAQLAVDMHETSDAIILKTLVAGVNPDELDITITREMVTIRGERVSQEVTPSNSYYYQELYWGPFSRTIDLPEEIDVEEAEATERRGLLEIKLPKVNKNREAKVRVKTG